MKMIDENVPEKRGNNDDKIHWILDVFIVNLSAVKSKSTTVDYIYKHTHCFIAYNKENHFVQSKFDLACCGNG